MDAEMLLKLLAVLKGGGSAGADTQTGTGGSPLLALLPLLMQGKSAGGGAEMLPLLMKLMGGSSPFAAAFGGGGASAAGTPPPEPERPARAYAREEPRERREGLSPFADIGFAGAEVTSFMEKLWRLRRRV